MNPKYIALYALLFATIFAWLVWPGNVNMMHDYVPHGPASGSGIF